MGTARASTCITVDLASRSAPIGTPALDRFQLEKPCQFDVGDDLKSALLNQARSDRRDPSLAECISARVYGVVAKDEVVIVPDG